MAWRPVSASLSRRALISPSTSSKVRCPCVAKTYLFKAKNQYSTTRIKRHRLEERGSVLVSAVRGGDKDAASQSQLLLPVGGLAGLQVLRLSCVALLKLLSLLRVALFQLLLLGIAAVALRELLMLSFLLLLEFVAFLALLVYQLLLLFLVFLVEFGVAGVGRRWTLDRGQILCVLVVVVRRVFTAAICRRMVGCSSFASGFDTAVEVAGARRSGDRRSALIHGCA